MTLLIGITIGLVLSRWLESLLTRVILRLPLPDKARQAVRGQARERDLDLHERGKVIRLADVDAAEALARPGQLFNDIQQHE